MLYVDRVGRKPVLTIGALGMAFSHFVIAIILAKNINEFQTHKAAGWAAVVMVWLFVVHFGYSWGPCAWILIAGKHFCILNCRHVRTNTSLQKFGLCRLVHMVPRWVARPTG